MKYRFIKKRNDDDQCIIADIQSLSVKTYDSVKITFEVDYENKRTMILTNVNYVLKFMINIISDYILHIKDVDFDTQHTKFHKNDSIFGFAKAKHDHFVMKNNFESMFHQAFFFAIDSIIKLITTKNWHKIFVHANNNVILNLERSIKNVKFSNDTKLSKTNECKTCALAKMHKIISRSNEKLKTSSKLFHRVIYDLMQFITAMNKDQWVSHFACFEKDFNLIFTHSNKSNAISMIRKNLKIMQIKFNAKIIFFRIDDERSLGKKFENMLSELKIILKSSSSNTFKQNKHSERKEKLLFMKVRALRIEADLPIYLWLWIIRVANFIMNKISMKKHSWRTLYEEIIGEKFNLAHLRKFECKIYSLNKSISRKEKIKKKNAHKFFAWLW